MVYTLHPDRFISQGLALDIESGTTTCSDAAVAEESMAW
jgi:hypothetical protein